MLFWFFAKTNIKHINLFKAFYAQIHCKNALHVTTHDATNKLKKRNRERKRYKKCEQKKHIENIFNTSTSVGDNVKKYKFGTSIGYTLLTFNVP